MQRGFAGLGLKLMQMQEVGVACGLDDDMADGDLGDGMGVRAVPSSTRKKSQSSGSESLLNGAGEAAWIPGLKTADAQQRARWKLPGKDNYRSI